MTRGKKPAFVNKTHLLDAIQDEILLFNKLIFIIFTPVILYITISLKKIFFILKRITENH